ncbi:hypothetical protein A2U01_0087421 [Trifolium medium]|uniref:Uncharacterized protein n=1 Tax=Trifolium medium TaxID=97028 RepID=A0A392TYB6_9FABA|nr:hypothetical protein [Trifolium medium]
MSEAIVFGWRFRAVKWDEKALHSSLHVSIESSSRPLNHVIVAPLRVSTKSLHFVAPCAW